ncbi:MAG: TlpA disulfide reductase family protein [Bacteroidota bacterium]
MKNKLIAIIAIIATVLTGAFFYNKYRVAPKLKFESIPLTDLSGKAVSIDAFKGKKLFVNFFATWCGPCLQEFPSLINLEANLEKENFQFLFISDEPISRLQTFHEQSGIPMVILRSGKKLSEYGIFTIPTSYVLNAEREIVFTKVGVADWTSSDMLDQLKAVAN